MCFQRATGIPLPGLVRLYSQQAFDLPLETLDEFTSLGYDMYLDLATYSSLAEAQEAASKELTQKVAADLAQLLDDLPLAHDSASAYVTRYRLLGTRQASQVGSELAIAIVTRTSGALLAEPAGSRAAVLRRHSHALQPQPTRLPAAGEFCGDRCCRLPGELPARLPTLHLHVDQDAALLRGAG
jgi:hypothetical protein